MKICKFKGPRGECGALRPLPGREGFDIMCDPSARCDLFIPLTNLDRVRALEIPALAELIMNGCEGTIHRDIVYCGSHDCADCWTDWLAEEAEEPE